ncbi:hypothetical protein [Nocardia nova]|uniref:hypothetical protein n=1 Tax=Nocardia nova TaxID=37330 RepID=UPI0033CF949A
MSNSTPGILRLHPDHGSAVQRYVSDICRMQDRLRYRGLPAELATVEGVHVTDRHGVTTVVARTSDIPHRYLLGIAGFRLSQYVRVGFMSAEMAARDALFCEPLNTMNPDDWHVVCLDSDTGEMLGYVELASNGGPAESVRSKQRRLFPVEEVHGIDIFETVGAPADLNTENVREVKRMMHAETMSDRRLRYRVSIELILGLQWVCESTTPRVRAVIGDAEAHVALRHIVTVGLNPTVVGGTTPRLPAGHLLHPCYEIRELVEPFYGEVPADIGLRREVAEKVVSDPNILANLRLLVAQDMKSRVTRVDVGSAVEAV